MSRHSKLQNRTGSQQARAITGHSGISTYPFGTYVSLLHHLPGVRGTWTNLGINTMHNGHFNLSYANMTATLSQWDADIEVPYVHLTRASSQHAYNTGVYWSVEPQTWNTDPGLSIGIWLRVTSYEDPILKQAIMTVWGVVKRSWSLYISITGTLSFMISTNGTSIAASCTGTIAMPTDKWLFVCAKWKPSTHIKVKLYFDGELQDEAEDTSGIPSSLYYNSSMTGMFGAENQAIGAADHLDGDLGAAHYSVSHFSDDLENTIYQLGRRAYKV